MFRSKIRIHTCRIILLTSLVWLLVDVALLTFYSDCFGEGWDCGKSKNGNSDYVPVKVSLFVFSIQLLKKT